MGKDFDWSYAVDLTMVNILSLTKQPFSEFRCLALRRVYSNIHHCYMLIYDFKNFGANPVALP